MFDPLVLSASSAKNSIIRAATAESLATSAGKPTQELVGKLEEIAARWPTPFHIYDAKAIRENAKRLKKSFSWKVCSL